MKKSFLFWLFFVLISGSLVFTACDNDDDDDDPPIEDPGTVTDIDENVYPTIVLGAQEWMAENLKTTRYRDGSPIAYPGNDQSQWRGNLEGAYAWYNDDMLNKDRYGAIYNYHAVANPNGLCPTGWRIPTQADWNQLLNYLGNDHQISNDIDDPTAAGNRLKSCRQQASPLGGDCDTNQHPRWTQDEINLNYGTDDFGFNALPGGGRTELGSYGNLGLYAYWWTTDEDSQTTAIVRHLNFDQSIVFYTTGNKNGGVSVRCIRND
jgi:uncharacterized protein (TIGR02145 family)